MTEEIAARLSKAVITSTMVKAAVFGSDANWGRILCAIGCEGAEFDPNKIDIIFESKKAMSRSVKMEHHFNLVKRKPEVY